MHSLTSLSLTFLLSYVAAQQPPTIKIIPFSTLPACAGQCPVLNAANDVCVPPAVPASNEDTYTACVCGSTQLAGLSQNANAVCTDVCSDPADLQAIQTAFNQLCNVVVPEEPGTPVTSAPGGASNTARPPVNGNEEEKSWISTHWQWIIFAVILVVSMIGFSILGVCLKRRHRRRVDARNATLSSHTTLPPPTGTIADRAGASTPSIVPGTAQGSVREMSGVGAGGMGMASGVAPPRRTFTGRSRSSTVNSTSGPVAWGPHQNMASARGYDNVPPSPVYAGAGGTEYQQERAYSPANGEVYTDTHYNTSSPHPPGSAYGGHGHEGAGGVSPISEHGGYAAASAGAGGMGVGRKNTNGAGAQRIREMRSKESVGRGGSTGGARTPVERVGTPGSSRRI